MESKVCIICCKNKEINQYYVHKQMADGHLGKCKDCTKMHVKERFEKKMKDPVFVESEKARGREKSKRLGYAQKYKASYEQARDRANRTKAKFPEKKLARNRTAKMKPNITGNHLHHWSYNKEHYKDVIELSVKEHCKAHIYLIYDQERMMYRTTEGLLLNTREAHVQYIEWSIKNRPD